MFRLFAWIAIAHRWLCVILFLQFLECLVAVAEMMEKSDVVSLSIKVLTPSLTSPTLLPQP
jgi:hypothetical protein